MSEITIYHNPNCTKSRLTLQMLEDRGLNPTVVKYLETPPSKEELDGIFVKLGKDPADVIRKQEPEYKESGADASGLTREDLLEKINKFPKLLERPIVVHGDKAAIGRPPENVLEIL